MSNCVTPVSLFIRIELIYNMLLSSFDSKTPLSETDKIVLPEKLSAFGPMSVTVVFFYLINVVFRRKLNPSQISLDPSRE